MLKLISFLNLIFVFSANAKDQIVVIIGDSLTAGYGIEKSKAYPALLETQFKKQFPQLQIKNAGVSGATSASAIKRLKWMLKLKPEVMILALGANDGLRGFPAKTTYTNLEQAILLAQKNNIKVILAGMQAPPNYGEKYTKEFAKVFVDLSKKHQIQLIPFLLKDVAGEKKYNQEDGIHPNEEGHQKMASTIEPYLKKYLEVKK